jgi:DNA polymerase-3 subunit alpha
MEHTVEQDHVIRLGLEGIKELSNSSKVSLLENRIRGGYYNSIEDFTLRSVVMPEDARILIAIGACDCFGKSREEMQLLYSLHSMSTSKSVSGRGRKKKGTSSQVSLTIEEHPLTFDLSHLSTNSAFVNFRNEKRYFGYSVTSHPCSFLEKDKNIVTSCNLRQYVKKQVTIQGYVASRKDIRTRKGDPMCLLNLTDEAGMLDVVVWSDLYSRIYGTLAGTEGLRVSGMVQENHDVYSIIAKDIKRINFIEEYGN